MAKQTITMSSRQVGCWYKTFVWEGSCLYIFHTSLGLARHQATTHLSPLVRGEALVDMPSYGLSLVWQNDTPYLFSGPLAAASHRGKTWKGLHRQGQAITLYHRRLEAAGFEKQYGVGIGEG